MIPNSLDSGSELLNMWSSNVADNWVIRIGSVTSGEVNVLTGCLKS